MLHKLAVVAALVVVLLIPVSARAAEPLDLGAGHKPGVAVDQGYGTAYIAWIGTESPSLLHFCRLPRGASACDVSSTIPAPANSLSRPYVASYKPANEVGHLAVISSRYGLAEPDPNQVWQFVSATGQDFDAGHAIGYPAFDEAVQGPALSTSTEWLFVATNAFGVEGMVFQAMPLEGGSAGAAHAVLSSDHPYHGSVGLHGDWNPIAVFSNGSSMSQFRRYDGSGDYNDVANWLPAVDIGYADYPRLASSYARVWSPAAHPNGIPLFLLAGTETGGLEAREWNGATFGPGATISDNADDAQSYLVQDIGIYGGRLDAFYPKGTADGLQLFHATSPEGVSWQSEALYTAPVGQCICQVRAAMRGFDDIGVAVWEQGQGDGARIKVLGVGSTAPPPAAPPPAAATPPAEASFDGSKSSITVNRKRRFEFTFHATPGLTGSASFKSARTIRVSQNRKKKVTLAKKSFTVPATGKVTLKIKLARKTFGIVKLNRKIRARVTVTLENAAGLTSKASTKIKLKAPKRQRRRG